VIFMKLNLLNPHHNEPHEVGATRRAKTENFALLEARRSTCGSGAPFRRVVINGAGGAGKSTLARELSARWKLPRIEADALFWEPGWREAAPECSAPASTPPRAANRGFSTAITIRCEVWCGRAPSCFLCSTSARSGFAPRRGALAAPVVERRVLRGCQQGDVGAHVFA
jgi:hypothetical protein